MTLEEKIGQLFIIRPESLDNPNQEINDANNYGITKFNQRMQETMKKYPVDGIVFFSNNIINPLQLTNFINQLLYSLLYIYCLKPNFSCQKYQDMTSIGNTNNTQNAKDVDITIGRYLKNNFNLNFAPIADVNTNRNNPIIGTRAFGNHSCW